MCLSSKPSDFYFHILTGQDCGYKLDDYEYDTLFVYITFVDYFDETNDEEGRCWDQHINIEHILPEDFEVSSEGVWECKGDQNKIEQEMLRRGFRKNIEFSEMTLESVS